MCYSCSRSNTRHGPSEEGVLETVDELPESGSRAAAGLLALPATLRELPGHADEALSYGMPAFVVGGKPAAGHARVKRHRSYYPHSGAVLSELADELDGCDWSKGTLRFPIDEPLPRQLTARLVEVKLAHLRSSA